MKRSSNLATWRYSVQPRDRIFLKNYGFLSFARNMGKNFSKSISKNVSRKYCQKRLDHTKQSATDALKTASKAPGDLIGIETADKTTTVSKNSPKNNLETNEEDTLREKYISPELRDLRLKKQSYWKFFADLRLI